MGFRYDGLELHPLHFRRQAVSIGKELLTGPGKKSSNLYSRPPKGFSVGGFIVLWVELRARAYEGFVVSGFGGLSTKLRTPPQGPIDQIKNAPSQEHPCTPPVAERGWHHEWCWDSVGLMKWDLLGLLFLELPELQKGFRCSGGLNWSIGFVGLIK